MKRTLIHAIINKVVVVVFVRPASTVLVAFYGCVGSILALSGRTPHSALLILPQKVKDHVPQKEDLVFKWCLTGQNEAKCVHKQYTTYWVESKHSTDSSSCRWPGTTAQVPSVNMLLKLWSWESSSISGLQCLTIPVQSYNRFPCSTSFSLRPIRCPIDALGSKGSKVLNPGSLVKKNSP